MNRSLLLLALLPLSVGCDPPPVGAPLYEVKIVQSLPHDSEAFTQGFFFLDGQFYESTGLKGESSLRRVDPSTGRVVQRADLPSDLFGEGATPWGEYIVQLTWQAGRARVYDRRSFDLVATFDYEGEGWGLTSDGRRLILSDGSENLRFFEPDPWRETGHVRVLDRERPVRYLNELEYVDGEVWANVWKSDRIARIDPETGRVVGWIELAALPAPAAPEDVANGIAWDAETGRVWLTGKRWPAVYEVEIRRR